MKSGRTACASAAAEARRTEPLQKTTILRAEGGRLDAHVGRRSRLRLLVPY